MSDAGGGINRLRPLPGIPSRHTRVAPSSSPLDGRGRSFEGGLERGGSLSRFATKRLPQFLLNHGELFQHGMCSFLCSTEADPRHFERFVEHSVVLKWDARREGLVISGHDAEFVFGGNAHDASVGSLRVQELLCDLKATCPDKVHLLIGTRDVIKARMATVLVQVAKGEGAAEGQEGGALKVLRDICEENKHWFSKGLLEPAGAAVGGGGDALEAQVGWMVDVVLGSEGEFGRMRDELAGGGGGGCPVERVVAALKDKLDKACGTALRYISQAELAYVFGQVLFVHGGVTDDNHRQVPDIGDRTPPLNVIEWVAELNSWMHRPLAPDSATEIASNVGTPVGQSKDWLGGATGGEDGVEGLLDYCLSSKASVVAPLGASKGPPEGARPLGQNVAQWLLESNICCVVSGGEYVGEVPLVTKSATDVMQVRCHTAQGRAAAAGKRGGGGAVCEVVLWREGRAFVHGKMSGNEEVEYLVHPQAPHSRDHHGGFESPYDPFVGYQLPTRGQHDWVRAKMCKAHQGVTYLIGDYSAVSNIYPMTAVDLRQTTGWVPQQTLTIPHDEFSDAGHQSDMSFFQPSVTSANPANVSVRSHKMGGRLLLKDHSDLMERQGSDASVTVPRANMVQYAESPYGATARSELSFTASKRPLTPVLTDDSEMEMHCKDGENPTDPSEIARLKLKMYRCPQYTPTTVQWLMEMPKNTRKKVLKVRGNQDLKEEWEKFVETRKSFKHVKARQPQPRLPQRFEVPDRFLPWDEHYDGYTPSECPLDLLPEHIRGDPPPEATADHKTKNPFGRTGLVGRGVFWKWGENKAIDPCITRTESTLSKRTQVLVCRTVNEWSGPDDYHELSLPGGMKTKDSEYLGGKLPANKDLLNFMRQLMMENMKKDDSSSSVNVNTFTDLDNIFNHGGKKVLPSKNLEGLNFSQGYCDDARNTDDAWVSTEVWHFHIPDKFSHLLDIPSHLSDWNKFKYQWLTVDSGLPEYQNLYASHKFFVDLCVPTCQCGRRKYTQDDGSHPSIDVADAEGEGTSYQYDNRPELRLKSQVNRRGQVVKRNGEIPGGSTGTLQFVGKSSVAKYVRAEVKDKDDARWVWKCLESWGMQQPHVVLSLTGAATSFDITEENKRKIFEGGILRAAQSMKAVVVTGGTDAGVMKYMGQAAEAGGKDGHLVPMLGIAPWGALIGREALLSKKSDEDEDEEEQVHVYSKNQPNSGSSAGIDTNHQYFVLVDDGTASRFGTEISARARMEYVLSNPKGKLSDSQDPSHGEHLQLDDDKQDRHARDLNKTLPICPRCEGVTEDPISYRLPKNSISEVETTQWKEVQAWLKNGDNIKDVKDIKYLTCESCKATLLREDVVAEEMIKCPVEGDEKKKEKARAMLRRKRSLSYKPPPQKPECKHYFFKSRVKAMRETGRRTIQCDNCNAHAPVQALLQTLIPSVLVVVEGGPGTMQTVIQINEAEAEERQEGHDGAEEKPDPPSEDWHLPQSSSATVPIVVVQGSGRAADFIAFVWSHLHKGKFKCGGHTGGNTVVATPRPPRTSSHDGDAAPDDESKHTAAKPKLALADDETRYSAAKPQTHRTSLCVAHVRRYKKMSADAMNVSNHTDPRSQTRQKPLLEYSCCPRINEEYLKIMDKAEIKTSDKKLISQIIEVCRRKDATELYELDSSKHSLDYHIMKAVCCGTMREGVPLSTVERLQLAIDWDRQGMGGVVVDMAQQELLDDGSLGQGDGSQYNRKKMVYALTYALCNNSPRFAELLDNAGVRIPAQESIIKELYPRSQQPTSKDTVTMNSMFWILNLPYVRRETRKRVWQALKSDKLFKSTKKNLKMHLVRQLLSVKNREDDPEAIKEIFDDKGMILKTVLEKHIVWNKYKFKSELLGTFIHLQVVMELLTGWHCLRGHVVVEALEDYEKERAPSQGVVSDKDSHSKKLSNALENNREASMYQELFLWAILMGRTDIAILYWRICNPSSHTHCITRALFACALSRKVAKHPLVDEQSRKQLQGDIRDSSTLDDNFSSRFEKIALDCLDLTFRIDQKAAVDALMVVWVTPNCWFDATLDKPEFLTPLTLAGLARADKFVDHAAFQMALDRLWHGYLIRDIHEATQDQQKLLLPFTSWHAKNFFQNMYLALASIFPPLCILLEFCKLPSVDDIHDDFSKAPESSHKKDSNFSSNSKNNRSLALGNDASDKMDPLNQSFSLSWLVARQIKKLVAFYNAPVVSFYFAATLYFLFCVLYTLVGLFMGKESTNWEIFLWIWTLTSFISVIRQAGTMGAKSFLAFGNTWELLMYALYILAFSARIYELSVPPDKYEFGLYHPGTGTYNNLASVRAESSVSAYNTVVYRYAGEDLFRARGLHAVVGILFWLRFLDMCRVNATLGPLIVVMLRMLTDIGYFLIITVIFMVSFGTAFICAFQPISDPPYACNGGDLHQHTFDSYDECIDQGCTGECNMLLYKYVSDVVFYTFKPMLGEQFVDESIFSAQETIDGVVYDSNRRLGGLLLLVYLIISAIMLLNLLIAIMNNTYTIVQTQSRQVWRYQRMEIVLYYAGKKGFPPPFSIILDLFTIFKYLYDLVRSKRTRFKKIPMPRGKEMKKKFCQNIGKLWETQSQKRAAFEFDDRKGGWLSRVMSMEYVSWRIIFNFKDNGRPNKQRSRYEEQHREMMKNVERLQAAAVKRRERAVDEARMIMMKRLKQEAQGQGNARDAQADGRGKEDAFAT